jgi:hypothetical protein
MKVGILGTGDVGRALGKGFIALGHTVKMGARDARNQKALTWAREAGPNASAGTFGDAAAFGDVVVLATLGVANESTIDCQSRMPAGHLRVHMFYCGWIGANACAAAVGVIPCSCSVVCPAIISPSGSLDADEITKQTHVQGKAGGTCRCRDAPSVIEDSSGSVSKLTKPRRPCQCRGDRLRKPRAVADSREAFGRCAPSVLTGGRLRPPGHRQSVGSGELQPTVAGRFASS